MGFQPTDYKWMPEAALLAQLADWRRQPVRIVFTNGVFDLLHRGHVSYLEAARALGDYLVLGLNSDASVRRLKGPTRPVNAAADRARVLAGLACIDAIVEFTEDTPLRLITAVLPDVLVKGGDYRIADIVGHELVLARGGQVLSLDFVEGYSTTGTLARLQGGPMED